MADYLHDGTSSDDVVIAVMGVTGAGKSTFIKRLTGRQDIKIGDNLTSETLECKAYRFQADGINFSLVDTPGFNDTFLDDAAILAQLASFMESTYRANMKLTAVIYLHPIINERLEGSALDNLSMFRKLCGPKFYPNIVLATTFWSKVDLNTGTRRETELKTNDEFWGAMQRRGSEVIRLPDDVHACTELVLRLAGKVKNVLQIQDEIVNHGLEISQTEAGQSAKNIHALKALQQEFSERLRLLSAQKNAELKKQQAEFERVMAKNEASFLEQLRINKESVEQAKREQEAALREAELRQQKAIKEQEELVRKTKLETERIRIEMEQLALKDAEERQKQQVQEKAQLRDKEIAAIDQNLRNQLNMFSAAVAAKTVRATTDNTFFAELQLGRCCDVCYHACSAQLSYVCTQCDDVDICTRCYEDGHRCIDETHLQYARRNLAGTPAGKCPRALYPLSKRFRMPCNGCGAMLKEHALYYHCCSCASDNFDLCMDCVIRGKTCNNSSHLLQLFRA